MLGTVIWAFTPPLPTTHPPYAFMLWSIRRARYRAYYALTRRLPTPPFANSMGVTVAPPPPPPPPPPPLIRWWMPMPLLARRYTPACRGIAYCICSVRNVDRLLLILVYTGYVGGMEFHLFSLITILARTCAC